jgi:hypothetical protein
MVLTRAVYILQAQYLYPEKGLILLYVTFVYFEVLEIQAGDFLDFFSFYVLYSTLLYLRTSDSTVSEDAGTEPRTVATVTLAVRRSNHSARSHPHSARSHLQL